MTWRMPAETAQHERTWMAFPRPGLTLGDDPASAEEAYAAWTAVAHAVAEFEPVTMVVDPIERDRAAAHALGRHRAARGAARRLLDARHGRDVRARRRAAGVLGGVDWIFNGWGARSGRRGTRTARSAASSRRRGRRARVVDARERGRRHPRRRRGHRALTETVQLDPRRNPYADKARVEAELARTIGATKVIWLPRGLTRDYEDFGTRGHVDIVATIPSPGPLLLHEQPNPEHPDHEVMRGLRAFLSSRRMPRAGASRSSTCPPPRRCATTRASSTGTTSTTSSSTAA